MSALLPSDTDAVLGSRLPDNRSLYFDRFSEPGLKGDQRKAWFLAGAEIPVPSGVAGRCFAPDTATLLFARLRSRLLLNMAGGAMENAGLCLDRYGLPFIPGSAGKGCARRMALQALYDWVSTSAGQSCIDDICAPCRAGFHQHGDFLAAIAQVFGWVKQDWSLEKNKAGQWKSDFAWACHGNPDLFAEAAHVLSGRFLWAIPDKFTATPWNALPNFGGSVAFLPAYPNRDPDIDLDVVTCHHGDYYQDPDPNAVAHDTEEPVPVFFPAVAPQKEGDYFTFPLFPLRGTDDAVLRWARTWLASGLEVFGLGAKTNAGYGWFDSSESYHQEILTRRKEEEVRQRADIERQIEAKRKAADAKAKLDAKAALDAILAGLSPDEQEDKKIELLSDAQFEARMRAFCKDPNRGGPSEEQRRAIVRALRGPRIAYWQTFKPKAIKGDLATIDQAIRQLSKAMNLGKMP